MRTIWASRVSAPTLVGAEGEGAGPVQGAADHLRARALRHRGGLAGDHRFVDEARAVEHGAVDGDSVAGADDEDVAGDDLGERHLDGVAVAHDPRRLGLEADEAADRLAGAAPRAGLEQAADEDQRGDHRGGLEADVDRAGRQQPRREGGDRRIDPGRAGAERDEGVHVRHPPDERGPPSVRVVAAGL
jgi:hypothetical protein